MKPNKIKNPTVTFGITCYSADAHYINRCLYWIKNQTVRPDSVIVLGSDMKIHESLKGWDNLFISNKLMTTGNARNKILSMCQTDILAFCDVDDETHPEKCRIIKEVFTKHNPVLFLHSYNKVSKHVEFDHIPETIPIVTIDKAPRMAGLEIPANEHVTYGHAILDTHIVKKYHIKYADVSHAEDAWFCKAVFTKIPESKNGGCLYSPLRLINYIK